MSHVEALRHSSSSLGARLLPLAVEASWHTMKFSSTEKLLASSPGETLQDFDVGLGKALLAMHRQDSDEFVAIISSLRDMAAKGLTMSTTTSSRSCHKAMLQLHALYEVEWLSKFSSADQQEQNAVPETLDRRLNVLGPFTSDKQYLLGLRRATMQLCR